MPPARLGVFRPFVWWIVASIALLLWQYHREQAREASIGFAFSVEGEKERVFREGTLNGLPYRSMEPSGVGWKTLVLQAENAEPFETNCFVWYSGKDFSHILLARPRGRLELESLTAVERVQIKGAWDSRTLNNITNQSLSLPVGRYTVNAKFARFSMEQTAEVVRNQITRVVMAPSLTALSLSSDPPDALFELNSTTRWAISVIGTTPASVEGLPVGEYALAITRGDYRKDLPIRLTGAKPTHELKVLFRYAKVSINSDPTNAVISDGSKVIGYTPANLDLQPGSYHLLIGKVGYFRTNVSLDLSDSDSRTISVNLANVSYVEALQRARNQLSGFSTDYGRALGDVEEALRIKPDDETALQLKRRIEFNRHLRSAREFQRSHTFASALSEVDAALKMSTNNPDALALKTELEQGQRAAEERRAKAQEAAAAAKARSEQTAAAERAEARRKHPEKILQDAASRFRYQELFPPEIIQANGSVEAVRAAVLRALGNKPEWSIQRNDKKDEDTVILQAEIKSLGSKHLAVLVAGQTADNEVAICFKVISLTLGDRIQLSLSGISEDSYKPLHPKYASPGHEARVELKRLREFEEFKKRIQDELR